MTKPKINMSCAVAALLLASLGMAQEKSSEPAEIPLKVTVVLNEYDGDKKVTSLPYVMPCRASHSHDPSVLRMGFQVPYTTGETMTQFQYRDVATNLDCGSALPDERGGFLVGLGVEHNVMYRAGPNGELRPGLPSSNLAPVLGGIHATLRDLLLHDGQTVNALTATDPVSGHVWKVEVTLNVVK